MIKKPIDRRSLKSEHLNLSKLQTAVDAVASGVSVVYIPADDLLELHIPDDQNVEAVDAAIRDVPIALEESDDEREKKEREALADFVGVKLADKFKAAMKRIKDLETRVDALENR